MKKKLKEYRVYCSETVFYEVVVKAKSEKDAHNQMFSGEVDFGQDEITDSDGFEVEKIELEN